MQHSFLQKLILVVLAGALAAAAYVYGYKGFLLSAEQCAQPLPASTARP